MSGDTKTRQRPRTADEYGDTVNSDLVLVLFYIGTMSGAILFAGYFFPQTVGTFIGGDMFLVAGVTFFGTFLVMLSIIPEPDSDTESRDDTEPKAGTESP